MHWLIITSLIILVIGIILVIVAIVAYNNSTPPGPEWIWVLFLIGLLVIGVAGGFLIYAHARTTQILRLIVFIISVGTALLLSFAVRLS